LSLVDEQERTKSKEENEVARVHELKELLSSLFSPQTWLEKESSPTSIAMMYFTNTALRKSSLALLLSSTLTPNTQN
jgi:hypothetical protein